MRSTKDETSVADNVAGSGGGGGAGSVAVTSKLSLRAPLDATTQELPSATADTRPSDPTVTRSGAVEDHRTSDPDMGRPASSTTCALNPRVCPNSKGPPLPWIAIREGRGSAG